MSMAYVEIDFFQMEQQNNASSKPSSPERDPSSFRGIQSVVSRINPQLLKTVMAAGHGRSTSANFSACPMTSNSPSPSRTTSPPPVSVSTPTPRFSSPPATTDTAPLTIFYNGTVTTFDVPLDRADAIMKMAEMEAVWNPAERPENSLLDGNRPGADLPIARRKSLQSFLHKRKERLASASPYHKASPSWRC